jgi:hypothetical protein
MKPKCKAKASKKSLCDEQTIRHCGFFKQNLPAHQRRQFGRSECQLTTKVADVHPVFEGQLIKSQPLRRN